MKKRPNILGSLDRLARAEERFLDSQFLAPVTPGGTVQVRIAGVRCRLRIEPRDFCGWGLFRPDSHTTARLLREAQLAERRRYLELFPALPMVLCERRRRSWLALPATHDGRFAIDGAVHVLLPEEVDPFDTIITRFDGGSFWYDRTDPRADPGIAGYLRQSLSAMVAPESLERSSLSVQQRMAYAFVYRRHLDRQQLTDEQRAERRLRDALAHAGAELREFSQRQDVYRVTYDVDGRRHVSVVRKDSLTVQSAGVCLSGQDQVFDLSSLVGVLREGRNTGHLLVTGIYEDED